MQIKKWAEIRNIISRQTNIPETILEYLSNIEILEQCAKGKSTKFIATLLRLDVEDVSQTLKDVFNIAGWDENLNFEPTKIYKKYNGDIQEYTEYLVFKFPDIQDSTILTTYYVASKYLKIKERLDEYYGNKNS